MGWKSFALLAAVFVAAGCGSTTSHSTTGSSASLPEHPLPGPAVVTPRQVERTFSRHGIRLVENYPNARPGPIVRADYRLPGRGVHVTGNKPNGWVTVYDSVQHAAVAKQRFRRIYGERNVVVRANVLVEFLRDADRAARQQVAEALSAVAS